MDLITLDRIQILSRELGFQAVFLEKDYYLTRLLYLIKDIKGLYFKGGTAINKILLDHPRLSEDIDFTCTRDVKEIGKELLAEIAKEKIFIEVPSIILIDNKKDKTTNENMIF